MNLPTQIKLIRYFQSCFRHRRHRRRRRRRRRRHRHWRCCCSCGHHHSHFCCCRRLRSCCCRCCRRCCCRCRCHRRLKSWTEGLKVFFFGSPEVKVFVLVATSGKTISGHIALEHETKNERLMNKHFFQFNHKQKKLLRKKKFVLCQERRRRKRKMLKKFAWPGWVEWFKLVTK